MAEQIDWSHVQADELAVEAAFYHHDNDDGSA